MIIGLNKVVYSLIECIEKQNQYMRKLEQSYMFSRLDVHSPN